MDWFNNLPIRRKLNLVMLLISTVVLVLACAALVAYERMAFRDAMARDLAILADVLAQNSTAAMQFDDPTTEETILRALRAEPYIVAACVYKADGNWFAGYSRAGLTPKYPPLPPGDGCRFEPDRLELIRPISLNDRRIGTIYVRADLEGMRARTRLYAVVTIFVVLGASLLTFVLSSRFQRVISHPILALANTARIISDNKDYSVRAEKPGHDEIGRLTEAFNQMLAEIEAGQSALQRANDSLRSQAGQIMESATVLGVSAGRILEFSTQVAASAAQTAMAVGETTTTVEEVRQTAESSSQRARFVADSAQRAAQTSQSGREATDETATGMERIRRQMEAIAQSMVRLSEQSQAIGQIIASVDDLAQQSKILSVNAAIEAAKAGEHGRGFAVVAQEIKNLAEQSRQATDQVRTILSDIQRATGASVMVTEQGSKAVESGVRQAAKAGDSLLLVSTSVAEAAQAAIQIAVSSRQQAAGMDQVANAMQSVRQSSTQNVESARQMEEAARALNELGQKLRKTVEEHKAGD